MEAIWETDRIFAILLKRTILDGGGEKMKTIRDIAKEAGVSVSTVSRVLNNSGYCSPETRLKVERAAVDYYPNIIAQEMVKGSSKIIGVMVSHTPEYFFQNPFYSEVLLGICDALKEKQYRFLLLMNESKEDLVKLFYHRQIEGLLLMSAKTDENMLEYLQEKKLRFVLIGDYHKCPAPIVKIDIDNEKYAYEAVTYLIGMGHRRIGYISGPLSNGACYTRLQGYKKALEDHEIQVCEDYIQVCASGTEREAVNAAKKLLYMSNHVTAIFGFNDTVAISVYKAAEDLGLRIPEDISVVGFDDSKMASYVSPPLTTVSQPSYEKGYEAAKILLDLVENGSITRPLPSLNCYMVFRKSCASPK